MLERSLEIKPVVSKASINIKEEQMTANVELETVTTIVAGLKPVTIVLEKLCSRNAEGVFFPFFIGELNEQNSEFAKNMYSLILRINERLNDNLIGLMQYLNFGRKYEAAAVTVNISRLPSRSCLVRQAQIVGTRFFCEQESKSNSLHSEESMEILQEKPLTLDEKKLEKAIYSKTKVLYYSTKKKVLVSTKS
ncbi:uncharacterized protein TNCV_3643481 [Trichonephila clavipes]|nr:uncharacterized protein TNCV_3643481 [Trichonephila clavipes]